MIDVARIWYDRQPLTLLLWPLSVVFRLFSKLRRLSYQAGLRAIVYPGVPVIIVGNITVGGTGKTPLVIALTHRLQEAGYRPGIISRGYRGKAKHWPQQVRPDSDPVMVGDEAVLLAQRTHCPIAVGPDRVAAALALVTASDCNILVSDDGLQHYRLGRDVEIAVIDGVRRLGNGFLLPAGPLREPEQRLKQVDFIVVNGGIPGQLEYPMPLISNNFLPCDTRQKTIPTDAFDGKKVHAVAAIGNPQRFFKTLRKLGIEVIEHIFPDHYLLRPEDIFFHDGLTVLMTEKDAVKCRHFATQDCYYLQIEASLDDRLWYRLAKRLPPPDKPTID